MHNFFQKLNSFLNVFNGLQRFIKSNSGKTSELETKILQATDEVMNSEEIPRGKQSERRGAV